MNNKINSSLRKVMPNKKITFSIVTTCYGDTLENIKIFMKHLDLIIVETELFKGEIIFILEKNESHFKKELEKILNEFISPIFIYINQSGEKSFADCLNLGISKSNSEYIVRVDNDDLLIKGKIDYQIKKMIKSNADISYTDAITEVGICKYPRNKFLFICSLAFGFNPILHPTVIFKRRIFGDSNIYNSKNRFSEDIDVWIKALISNKKFIHINYPYTNYSIKGTKNKSRKNAIWQIKIRYFYIVKLTIILFSLISGLIINSFRLIIPVHHNSFNFLRSIKPRRFLKNLLKKYIKNES